MAPPVARRQVVGVVVVDRVDVGELDEVLDLDRLGLLGLQRLELAGLDDHVAVGRELEALDDVVVGDLVARRGVDALLRDAHAGLAAELVEAHGLAVDRAVELDGDGDQAERDRTGPDRARHGCQVSPMRPAIPPGAGGIAARNALGAARGLRGVLVAALGELLDDLGAEGRQVVGLAAGHEALVDDDLLVDPVGARVAQVRLQRRPRGHRAAPGRRRPRRGSTARGRSTPTGFLASKKARTKAMASASMRRESGLATPPGATSPS